MKGVTSEAEILNSPQQLIRQLAFWIDGYYNRERRHSTIGYLSPIDYEQQAINTRTLTPWSPETCPLNRGNPKNAYRLKDFPRLLASPSFPRLVHLF
jgi:hypothetical protein